MLSKIFLQVLNMSFTASFVIICILFVRLFLKKVPKIFSYSLWAIALFRLILPFSFKSIISFLPINSNPIPTDIMYSHIPQINTGIPFINNSINSFLPAPPLTVSALTLPSVNPMINFVNTGMIIWIVGIIILLIYSVISLIQLHVRLRSAVCDCETGNVYISKNISTPFVTGLFRPKIYLPENLSHSAKQYIIMHEQTHIKHWDHVIKLITFFVVCIHWYNPLVWMAFFASSKDMEMTCDERVIKQLGNEIKKDYTTSLLSLATGRRIVNGTPLAFGEGDTKGRIKNVLNYKKPRFWVVTISAVVVMTLCLGLISNPKNEYPLEPNNSGIVVDYRGATAEDVFEQYQLALLSSDYERIAQLTPTANPVQEVIDTWKQISISKVDVIQKDIRDNKAAYTLSVTVDSAPDGFGIWTAGTATHYLYLEKSDDGWYVKSYGAGGKSEEDLTEWWGTNSTSTTGNSDASQVTVNRN